MTQSFPHPAWLENAILYQIYPQSFYDSNGDGIGDIPGIILKLEYLHRLGVNLLWLNPCFTSPFIDAGYDVSDYYQVAPRYGTKDDLRRLFTQARSLGMRVLLDLVAGHTSIQHPWFQASCRHERNEFSDYYIWTDSAFHWEVPGYRVISGYAERHGSYLTNFFYCQPALNYGFANPDPHQPWQQSVDSPGPRRVRQEMKHIMRYWLEMGASGFRVDMAGSLVKGDPGQRETIKLWQEMRFWLDQNFPEAVILSEWGVPEQSIEAGFHLDFCLPYDMPGYTGLFRKPYGPGPGTDRYGFSFFDRSGHGNVMEFLDNYLPQYNRTRGRGLIVLPTGNHDINPRINVGRSNQDLELIYLFLMTMPGVPAIYYGDEIGMRTVEGLPSKEGGYERTGSRTPMQWDDSPNAGFSSASAQNLYLPIDTKEDRPLVSHQEQDADSLLHRVRKLIELRKSHPALCATGNFEIYFAEAGKTPLAYFRRKDDDELLVVINPAGQSVELPLPDNKSYSLIGSCGREALIEETGKKNVIRLAGISGAVYQLRTWSHGA